MINQSCVRETELERNREATREPAGGELVLGNPSRSSQDVAPLRGQTSPPMAPLDPPLLTASYTEPSRN